MLAAVLDALIGTTAATDALPAAPRQLRLETEERVAEAVARAGAPRSFTVCLWSDGFTVRAEGLPAAPPVSRGNVFGLADFAEPAGPLQSYGDHLPFLRAIRDGEVPPQFLPGGDVVRLDVEDYLPCSYAQCRHLLDAAPAHERRGKLVELAPVKVALEELVDAGEQEEAVAVVALLAHALHAALAPRAPGRLDHLRSGIVCDTAQAGPAVASCALVTAINALDGAEQRETSVDASGNATWRPPSLLAF